MSKRVLYIGGFELPDKNAAAQRVVANAKILQQFCDEVILVGTSKDANQKDYISEIHQFEGIDYYSIKYPKNYKAWFSHIISIKYIVDLIKQYNFTHIIAYNYPGVALYRLKKLCSKKGIKLIADCTEWYEATQGNILYRTVKKIDVYVRMKITHPKLDGLIVISDYLYDYYSNKKVKNIINAPPLVDLRMPKWQIEPKLKANEKITLIYAGSPGTGQKDRLEEIIKALQELKEQKQIILTVVGISKEQYQTSFNVEDDEIKKLDGLIDFKGRLSHIETLKMIKSSDYQIFVRDKNLTNTAGFPTKYVEAISCGTPVLTNSSSSIVNFYEEGKTGFLLDNTSPENLVNSLKKVLLENKQTIQMMKDYCRTSKVFDISKFKNKFIELFDNV